MKKEKQQQHKRNDQLMLNQLFVGDRFYFAADASKRIYQLMISKSNQVEYAPSEHAKPIRATKDTMGKNVIYLRNINKN